VVRLGLPIAAGLGLAAALFSLLPSAHLAAAGTLGRASWLGVAVPTPVSVPAVAHQIAAEALLTGYRDLSFLPQWITGIDLAPLEQSLDPPLWTMHIEFAGSLLVAALVALRASVGRATYVTTCLGLSVCFMASPLILFIVGHLAADRLGRGRRGICTQILGAALLLSGVLLCSASGALASSVLALPHLPPIGPALGPRDIQIVVGVLLIFFGLDSLPILCRCAETPPARWFGKISFSLYLTHYPILFTLTATIYTLLPPGWSDEARLAATGLTGIVISVLIASLFQRCIDRPAIDLSRRLPRFIAWRPPASTAIETVQ
jgi:peptidoglycan/LPS O-acetylase OafA/YrhL